MARCEHCDGSDDQCNYCDGTGQGACDECGYPSHRESPAECNTHDGRPYNSARHAASSRGVA
jgi:hypothetical protein